MRCVTVIDTQAVRGEVLLRQIDVQDLRHRCGEIEPPPLHPPQGQPDCSALSDRAIDAAPAALAGNHGIARTQRDTNLGLGRAALPLDHSTIMGAQFRRKP